MAKLTVPPVDLRLAEIFQKILNDGKLNDDKLWQHECLPLLLSRLDTLHSLVKEAQVSNANTPDLKIVDHIFATIDKTKAHLREHFETGAPFTVHRLSELLLDYTASGYLLQSVEAAQKYILAFARTAIVLLKETDYLETLGDPEVLGNGDYTINGLCSEDKDEKELADARENGHTTETEPSKKNGNSPTTGKNGLNDNHNGNVVSFGYEEQVMLKRVRDAQHDAKYALAQEYEDHDLPTNIKFVSLQWGGCSAGLSVSDTVQDFDVENSVLGVEVAQKVDESPPKKKVKNEETKKSSDVHLLSPLQMEGKIKDADYNLRYYEEKNLEYEVDRSYSSEVLF